MTVYHAKQTATGTGDGSSKANSMSLAAANAFTSMATGGDTLEYHGIFTSVMIFAKSGSSDVNRNTYDLSDADVRGAGSLAYAIVMDDRSYIDVLGVAVDGQGLFNTSNIQRAMSMYRCTWVHVDGSSVTRTQGYAGGIQFADCMFCEIENISFSFLGAWDRYQWGGADHTPRGNGITVDAGGKTFRSQYNYFHDCTFVAVGHAPISTRPVDGSWSYNIYERITFDGRWGQYTGPDFVGATSKGYVETGDLVGYRCMDTGPGMGNLFEDCIFKRSSIGAQHRWIHAIKFGGKYQIVRKCFFFDLVGPGLTCSTSPQNSYTRTDNGNNKIYHNSFYDIGGPLISSTKSNNKGNGNEYLKFFNNAAYLVNQRVQYDDRNDYLKTPPKPSTSLNSTITCTGGDTYYGNDWYYWKISGNCIAGNESASDQTSISDLSGGEKSFTWLEANVPAVFFDNTQADPGYQTIPCTQRTHFSLTSGSAARTSGKRLATVSGTGSGTSVTVDDASVFFDGWGGYWKTGDTIQIGSNVANRATITEANISTNVLTLDASLTWSNNDPVYWADFVETATGNINSGALLYGGAPSSVTANPDTHDTTKNHALEVISVLTNDDGTSLTVTGVTYTAGNGSTIAVTAGGGSVDYTPGTDFVGTEQFTYDISDGTNTDTGTVTVNVTDPTAVDASGTVVDNKDADATAGGDFAVDTSYTGEYGADSDVHSVDEYTP